MGAGLRFLAGVAGGAEEGVVLRVDEQGGDGDGGQERAAATTFPVVLRVPETVEGGGEAAVELGEGPHFFQSGEIEDFGEPAVLFPDLGTQRFHETCHVERIFGLPEAGGGAGEIAGRGEGDGAADLRVEIASALAEVFQREVAAEAETDEIDPLRRMDAEGMADDDVEIFGLAAVVEGGEAVGFIAAAAQAPGEHIPAALHEGARHGLDVIRPSGTLQAVR